MKTFSMIAAAALAMAATTAHAEVTFDPATGTGFVGKGNVQLAFGWNNATLQRNADGVSFAVLTESVTEVEWTCTNTRNENVQERSRTTTTTTEGLVDSVGRLRNQVTGFNLLGYTGGSAATTTETAGPPLNGCPTFWVLTPAGDPVEVSSSSSFTVTHNGITLTL